MISEYNVKCCKWTLNNKVHQIKSQADKDYLVKIGINCRQFEQSISQLVESSDTKKTLAVFYFSMRGIHEPRISQKSQIGSGQKLEINIMILMLPWLGLLHSSISSRKGRRNKVQFSKGKRQN